MKILKLRFQNLNSLVGEWEIDFTHPAYIDEGIFAITGATGAGKSTILDAICLALYGATPRLKDITKSKNDLMSRQTFDCFSEVIFATHSNSYRCTWSQKRAKKTGTLQSPKHEIAEYIDDNTDGKLIEEKASLTKAEVEKITGMDFHRFTRAMLLAQGSFSAFLQASSDERSPILEQITGTEIYSDISKKVHEFNRNADLELTSLKGELSFSNVLTDEDEQSLITQKNDLLQQLGSLKAEITAIEQDKQWRQSLTEYQQQIAKFTEQKSDIEQKIKLFAPQLSRLKRATKASQISGDVKQLRHLRHQLSQQTADLANYQQQLPTVVARLDTAKTQLDTHQMAYHNAEMAWTKEQPVLTQIRTLDNQRHHQQQLCQDSEQQLIKIQQSLANNQLTINQTEQQLNDLKNKRNQYVTEQQNIPHADKVSEHLTRLANVQETLEELEQQRQTLQQEHTGLQQQQTHAEQTIQRGLQQRQQLDDQLQQAKAEHHAIEQTLADLMQGQSLGELQKQGEQLWQAQNQSQNLSHTVQEWQQNHAQIQHQHSESGQITTTLNQLSQQLNFANDEYQHLEENLETLNHRLRLLTEIESLTQKRDRLVKGEPCPLCGSTDHPLATYNPNHDTQQAEQALTQAKTQLNQVNQHIQRLNLDKNNQQNRQRFLGEQLTQLTERNQYLAAQSQTLVTALPNAEQLADLLNTLRPVSAHHDAALNDFNARSDAFLRQLADYQHRLAEQSTILQQRLSEFERQQIALQHAQQHIVKLEKDASEQLNQHILLQSEQQHRLARLQEIDKLRISQTQKQTELHQRIDALFSPFITPHNQTLFDPSQPFAQRFAALQQLWQHMQQLSQNLQHLTEQINQTNTTLASLSAQKQSLSLTHHDEQQKQQQLSEKLQQLNQQRQQAYGEKNVDAEENRLLTDRNNAFHAWEASKQSLYEASEQQQRLQQSIDTLTAQITDLNARHDDLQHQVTEQFAKLGFADDNDFDTASMTDSEREQLQRHDDALSEQQQRTDSLLTQAKTEAQALLATPRTELSIEQLTVLLDEKQQTSEQWQKALGGIEKQLEDNEQSKNGQNKLLETIEIQSRHAKEWKDLHELIGSSDGKKFRNFAQGLTFNIMINHANEQLKKMSERYLLLADEKEPLMLNVMDNYQGGEIRTSKNLSGGESFIISLALALGLSNMASHRMQVDSLFLDEGFGTLDDEALDVALDTLTGLQQSGKLIGVISHIQALKDRISRQIKVVPQSGGISKIEGFGVRRMG